MAGLIPKVVTKGDVAHGVFPAANNLKILVQMQVATRRLALGVPQHRDDDLGPQTMNGMGGAQVCLGLDLGPVDHFEQRRIARVSSTIDDVDI